MTQGTQAAGRRGHAVAAVAVLTVLLAGCGGGGSASGDTTPVVGTVVPIAQVDIPVQVALSAYARTSQPILEASGTISTTQGTVPVVLHYQFTPDAAATTFEGSAVYSAREQLNINRSDTGALLFQSDQRSYFTVSPYALYGSRDLFRSTYSVVTRTDALPATVRVGQAGAIGTVTTYTDETKAQIQGTPKNLLWTVEADGTSTETVLLCMSASESGAASGSSYCYRISRSGAVQNLVIRPALSA